MEYQTILESIYASVLKEENVGAVAKYIPELAKVDPSLFGVCLRTIDQQEYSVGDWQTKFSTQSISKVLSLSMCYKHLGDSIWDRVGVEPSGNSFNSLVQLETDRGIPRNPLINAGAMVICDLLISHFDNAKASYLDFIKNLCQSDVIEYSKEIAQSERSVGYRNIALCNFIKSFGNIKNEPEEVLDFYFHMCSVEMTCGELCKAFMFLIDDTHRMNNDKEVLEMHQSARINALMQTCGFYDESGEFSFRVGLPGKSGVGGGIVALHPDKYCIAVWSPKLNAKGNSNRGMRFLELFTNRTKTTIF